jgi:glutamine amidotransferase
VHSYFVECDDQADVTGVASYGHEFVAAVEHDRVLGVQFHAEKSHRFGMTLLKRFAES